MWLTEFGWPGNAHAGGDYYPSLAAQATDVAQAYQALESPALSFVQAAFWFNQRDYQPGVANPDPAFFAHYGLLFDDFAPKPAAAVFERFARGRRLRRPGSDGCGGLVRERAVGGGGRRLRVGGCRGVGLRDPVRAGGAGAAGARVPPAPSHGRSGPCRARAIPGPPPPA